MGESRRRGAVLEEAILDAAWAELVATGYGGFTMAGVAAKAGTSKAVLYRRWPGKEDLVSAVLERRVPRLGRPARTGDLRADTLAILQSVAAGHHGLLAVGLDPGLTAALRRRKADEATAQLAEVVAAAGFDPAAIGPRILRLPIVVLQHALLDGSASPDMAGTVDEVFLPLVHLRDGDHV
ncbi:helix-turn-helix domain-containing protein [Actinoallomurus sp. NPDC050550]|uniref:TetR/AcrR family transcriptional regulator n=1 Tax=Actinoallomurus sp. NPDC050550 TaxID=3154937 RepID=UPI0033F820F7